jgi:subtilase family serine protease
VTGRGRALRLAAAVALAAAACSAGPDPSNDAPRSPGGHADAHRSTGPGQKGFARLVGPADPRGRLQFSVVLRTPRRPIQRFLDGVNDPASPLYRHYLDANAFGRRFGPPARDITRAKRELEAGGLHVVRIYPQRTSIDLSGPVSAVSGVFGVRMGEFVDRTGRHFRAPLSDPVVPADLRTVISAVAGLNTGPVPATLDVPQGGLNPTDVAKAYDITPLRDQGIEGQGQTIAIVSFASFRPSDVDEFDRLAGIQSGAVEQIKVNGGSTETTSANSGEVNLDIDVVRGVAPQAHIINYEAPISSIKSFTTGVSDVIDRIVQDGKADIVSMSWGLCDVAQLADGTPWLSKGDRLRATRAYQAAVAKGMSIFVASGDAGAFGCQRFDLADHRLTATWPSDDPNVVSVGGTLLSVRNDGSYLGETGWEDMLQAAGGGGGLNPTDPRPSYQQGPGVDNDRSNGKRQFPDVAAAADPDSGFFAVTPDPKTRQPQPNVVGGTSAATPFWAASMVLIKQFAQKQGVRSLGFVNPVLYRIASSSQGSSAFHDVKLGGNRFNNCTPGWDYSTGLGSPDVAGLAKAMVAELKR